MSAVLGVGIDLGPYVAVEHDEQVSFKTHAGKRTFRLITYRAFNALGLIGPECNGIAVLDEDNKEVVCDEIARESTGYFGISQRQLAQFNAMLKMSWGEFKDFVNQQQRKRFALIG